MADQQTQQETSSNDEIDLGQLFRMIGNGFNRLFRWFLRIFLYFKKNFLILFVLAVAGVIIAIGLNQFVTEKLKIEVIVKPNLESKGYLYDVVDEIQANIEANDTTFFRKIGLNIPSLKGFEITINQNLDQNNSKDDLEYLELLEKFQENGLVSDIIRTEILNKSSLDHKITFSFKEADQGQQFAQKVMQYINSNNYYKELTKINEDNAKERIRQDEVLLAQMDELIRRFSDKMASSQYQSSEQRIVLDNEKELDIAELFKLKNSLIRDIETKKIELGEQKETISIMNFGEPQRIQKSILGKRVVFTPIILIAIFFLIDIIKFLNKKSKEIQ